MVESISRIRSRHGCNASSRVLREAFSHCVSVSRRGICAVAQTAAAKPAKRKVRRSMLRLSKLDTVRSIQPRREPCNAKLRQCGAAFGRRHLRHVPDAVHKTRLWEVKGGVLGGLSASRK